MLPRDKSETNCEWRPDKGIKSSNNVQVGALIGPFIVRSLIGRFARSVELGFVNFLVDHSKMSKMYRL